MQGNVYLCIHAPRKEWRNRLPIRIEVVAAKNKEAALERFIPFHPLDPDTLHYNKPYARHIIGSHLID